MKNETKPECICTITAKVTRFNKNCYYHGDNGTMVSVIKLPKSKVKPRHAR